jgi:replicative DNA helicase
MSKAAPQFAPVDDGATAAVNIEAEQALLGAILVNNRAFDKVAEILRPEHFAERVHGRIYEAMCTLMERGEIANPITLKKVFDQDGALTEIGGAVYLAKLATSVVTVVNAEDYARTIADMWKRRQALEVLDEAKTRLLTFGIDHDADEQIEITETQLAEITGAHQTPTAPAPLADALDTAVELAERVFKAGGQPVGVPTGYVDLDRTLGGLHPSDLIIIAGRPSMGKTALATCIAKNAAERHDDEGRLHRVAFFSLEMSREQLAARMLAAESTISTERQRAGPLSQEAISDLMIAKDRLRSLHFIIDDTPAASVAAIRTRARRLQRMGGLSLVVIDYLQLIVSGREENRTQEISKITRELKVMAKELQVPVIALSQLSRAVEARENKRPLLSDLRESGSIEQDADVVMFVFREHYYIERAEPMRRGDEGDEKWNNRMDAWHAALAATHGKAEAIVAKNRQGAIGKVNLYFDGDRAVFDNLAQGNGQ